MQGELLDKNILELILNALFGKRAHRIERSRRSVNIKVIVAVNSRNFLDDIRLECDVLCRSPARNINGEIVTVKHNLKAESRKRFNDSIVVNLDARVAVNKPLIEAESNLVELLRILIGKARSNLYSAVKVAEKLNKTCNRRDRHFGIKALFISHRSVRSVGKTG